jgi:hypothetical protein
MASITIQVTVQSGTFLWTRTAVVEGLLHVGLHSGNALNVSVGGSEASTGRMGIYSYGGIAVAVLSNKGRGSILQVSDRDASDAQIGSALLPTYLPHIVYGGAGTGFTGALSASATGTDLPTDDIDGILSGPYMGGANTQYIYGFKVIS